MFLISTKFFSSRTSKSLSSAKFASPLGKPNLCYIQIGICGIYSTLQICMYICIYILHQWGSSAFLCRFIFGSTSSAAVALSTFRCCLCRCRCLCQLPLFHFHFHFHNFHFHFLIRPHAQEVSGIRGGKAGEVRRCLTWSCISHFCFRFSFALCCCFYFCCPFFARLPLPLSRSCAASLPLPFPLFHSLSRISAPLECTPAAFAASADKAAQQRQKERERGQQGSGERGQRVCGNL